MLMIKVTALIINNRIIERRGYVWLRKKQNVEDLRKRNRIIKGSVKGATL